MDLSIFDVFGNTDPGKMPAHFFSGAKFIDYKTAIRADTSKQDCSVAPRHWYIDCDFDCPKCGREITWTAQERKAWFELYRFWVDSNVRHARPMAVIEPYGFSIRAIMQGGFGIDL